MRLVNLSAVDLLDYAYFMLTKDRDAATLRKIELMLMGRLGEHGGEIIDDPDLPESMQGMEAPSWWNGSHDPWAEQHRLAADTQF